MPRLSPDARLTEMVRSPESASVSGRCAAASAAASAAGAVAAVLRAPMVAVRVASEPSVEPAVFATTRKRVDASEGSSASKSDSAQTAVPLMATTRSSTCNATHLSAGEPASIEVTTIPLSLSTGSMPMPNDSLGSRFRMASKS